MGDAGDELPFHFRMNSPFFFAGARPHDLQNVSFDVVYKETVRRRFKNEQVVIRDALPSQFCMNSPFFFAGARPHHLKNVSFDVILKTNKL